MTENENTPALCCSRRLDLSVMTLLGVTLLYGFRVTMSVAMVCMTSAEQCVDADRNDTALGSCDNATTRTPQPEFDWDKTTQGVILGSFFWAYFLTPIPGGWVAERVGGKKLFGTSVLLCSMFTLLTPIAAQTHLAFLIVVRVLCGLAQGLMWPAQQMVWARWAPPLERTFLSGLSVSGISLGNVIAFPVSGILCTYGFGTGWPSIFYVYGGVGLVWCLAWTFLTYESPAVHTRISEEERTHIQRSLNQDIEISNKAKKIPWLKIFKSPPVWSIVVTITCVDWGYYTFLTNIPAYLKEIYNYDILEGGFLSAMPFLGSYLMMLASIPTADFLRRRGYMTTTNVRKLFNSVGSFLPALLLILTSQLEDNPNVAVALLTMGVSLSGCVMGAVTSSNALDIASIYSGIVMGIALCCSRRLELSVMTLLGVTLLYGFRVTMSVAMVCMTSAEQCVDADRNDTALGSCDNATTRTKPQPEFDWNKPTQGVILGSFFWAYFLTPIPGGWVAERVGGKKLFGTCVLLCSVFTLLTPVAAQTHLAFLIAVRVLCGLSQGLMWPAQQMVWARWAPPMERTFLSGLSVSGMSLGNVIAFSVSGILCTYGLGSGWPSIFYVYGSVGLVWCLVWTFKTYESPAVHARISEEERVYILKSLSQEIETSNKPKKIPWLRILKSPPMWAFAVAITCADWGYYTFLTNIPTYLKEIYNYDILEGGFLSAMPFLGSYLMMIISIPVADFLRRRGYMTTTNVRKLFNSLGSFLPALLLILTSQIEDKPNVAVALLTIGVSIAGCVIGALTSSNALDIASTYSGIVMGIGTSISTISGILAPLIIGVVTTDGNQEQWHIVFYIVAAIYFAGGVFYLVFGSGELQDWAKDEKGDVDSSPNTSCSNIEKA